LPAKQDDLTEKMEKPDKMQACQRGLLETACNSWLSLSYRSHPKDLQDIIDDIDAQFWNQGALLQVSLKRINCN